LQKFNMLFHVLQSFAGAGGEIVNDPYPHPVGDKPADQVGPDESCAAAH
jgi:hypothetical protein